MPPRDKISRLPVEVRAAIDRLLIASGFSGYDALERIVLEAHGVQIGKSTLNRYGMKLQRRLDAIRASTEAARAIAEAAPDEADHRSAAVISLVQSSLFEAMLALEEAEDADPTERVKLLSQAARAVAEASRASIGQKKWAEEVKTKLDAIEREAGRAGRTLDAETLKAVREGLYGG
jgi:hypothetical protein